MRDEAIRIIEEAKDKSPYRLRQQFELLIAGIPEASAFKDLTTAGAQAKNTIGKLLKITALLEAEIEGEVLALQTQAAGTKLDPTKFGKLTRKIELAKQLKRPAGQYYVMKEELEKADKNVDPTRLDSILDKISSPEELYQSDNEGELEGDLTQELDQFSK